MTTAASGMRARMESLEMLANNVANSGTIGFKADREFYSVYASEEALANAPDAARSPLIEKHWTDFAQGNLLSTGNPLDLGINGPGYFVVDGPSGPLYTRNGNFRIGTDGQIQTQDGARLRVRTTDNRPIRLDPVRPIDIGVDGTIKQDGNPIGKIETFALEGNAAISKRGSTYFEWRDTAPPKVAAPEIRQGSVESSNVPVAESAVKLVTVMRQFEMLQRAMTIGGEMNRRLDDVAKVS